MNRRKSSFGFTFIELIVVIVIIAILSALLLPRYWDVARQARIATLDGVVGAMRSAIGITRAKALSQGIRPSLTEVDSAGQDAFIVQMEGFKVEVDWANLCPESRAERGDSEGKLVDQRITMLGYLMMESNSEGALGELKTKVDNQYTWIGYTLPSSAGAEGCYVEYDSFGERPPAKPSCPIKMVIDKC
jgi:MSHA pilin protein MshA